MTKWTPSFSLSNTLDFILHSRVSSVPVRSPFSRVSLNSLPISFCLAAPSFHWNTSLRGTSDFLISSSVWRCFTPWMVLNVKIQEHLQFPLLKRRSHPSFFSFPHHPTLILSITKFYQDGQHSIPQICLLLSVLLPITLNQVHVIFCLDYLWPCPQPSLCVSKFLSLWSA